VIYRWDSSKSKHLPRFDPKEYTITAQKGTMLTASRDDHSTTRNASFFQKINYLSAIVPQRYTNCFMFSDPFAKRRLQIKQNELNKQKELQELIEQNQARIDNDPARQTKDIEDFKSISDEQTNDTTDKSTTTSDNQPENQQQSPTNQLKNHQQKDNEDTQTQKTPEDQTETEQINKRTKRKTTTPDKTTNESKAREEIQNSIQDESQNEEYETPKHIPTKKRQTATDKLVKEAENFIAKTTTASEQQKKTSKSGEGDNISDKS